MIRSLMFLVLLAVGWGCNPVITFDTSVSGEATIPAASLLEQLIGGVGFDSLTTFDLASSSEFQNRDVRREQVTSARLKQLKLTVVNPSSGVFDFLDSIAFKVAAQGQATEEIARGEKPGAVRETLLQLSQVELAPYVRASSMGLSTEVSGHRPSQETTVRADATFIISATVFRQ